MTNSILSQSSVSSWGWQSLTLTLSAQHKNVVKRFTDSLLSKINKLRALIKDLKKNYVADSDKNPSGTLH